MWHVLHSFQFLTAEADFIYTRVHARTLSHTEEAEDDFLVNGKRTIYVVDSIRFQNSETQPPFERYWITKADYSFTLA